MKFSAGRKGPKMPTMLDDIDRMKDILNSAEQHTIFGRYVRANQKLYELAVVTREYDRPPRDKPKAERSK